MHVLVTGGAGFIGSHVVDWLLGAGHSVTVLDNLDPQVHPNDEWPEYLPRDHDRCVRWRMAVQDLRHLKFPTQDWPCDACVHLAAKVGVGQSALQPASYASANSWGTACLLECLAQIPTCKRLVVASSMSCYGEGLYVDPVSGEGVRPGLRDEVNMAAGRWEHLPGANALLPVPIPEDQDLHPESIYAETKATTERMSLIWGEQRGVPTAACRLFNVYGPRQALTNPYTGVAAIFASAALRGESPMVYEDGGQTRDFVHVLDVAEAVGRLATEGDYHGAVNVCTGQGTSVLDLARVICREAGSPAPRVTGQFRAGDIRHCIGDNTLLRSILPGWTPRAHGLAQVRELVAWARQQADLVPRGDPHAEMQAAGLLHQGTAGEAN